MNVPDIGGKDNPERPRNPERTLMNWQMQAAGADMLRIACILADHEGVKLVAPVHDALLIEAEESEIENAATITRQCMEEASRLVLDGFRIDTDCIIIPYKSRYPETGEMWNTIKRMIGVGTTFETEEGIAQGSEVVLHG
jgi:DNA polymerase I